MQFARRIGDILISLVILVGPMLSAFAYAGPYKWIAELQLAALGQYYETLTFLLTFLIWIVGCGGAVVLVKRLIGKNASVTEAIRSNDSTTGRLLPAIVIAAVLVALGLSGYFEYRCKSTHGVMHVSINDMATKHWWPGQFIAIDDAGVDPQMAVEMTESGSGPIKSTTSYLPLIPNAYAKNQPVHAIVEVNLQRLNGGQIDPKTISKGVVSLMGLPGMVRVQMERNGNPPTVPCAVITYGSSEDEIKDNAVFSLCMAGVILLVGTIVILRVRKLQK